MKTIQLSLTDKAFAKINTSVTCAMLAHTNGCAHEAWQLVLEAMTRGDAEKTIRTPEEDIFKIQNPNPELR